MVELVRVEEVARPGRRQQEHHAPVGEQLGYLYSLRGHVGVAGLGNSAAVGPPDRTGGKHGERQQRTGGHECHEDDIRTVIDRTRGSPTVIKNKGDEAADDAAHIEDAPEDADVRALAGRRRVGGQDGALGGP